MTEPETEPGNATALCRKWLRGRCRHGITCLYRHGSPSNRRNERDEEFGPPPLIPAGTSAEDGTTDSAAPIQAGVGYKARAVVTGGSDSSGLHHTELSYREAGTSRDLLGRILYAAHNAGPDLVPGHRDVEENRDLESRLRRLFRQRVRDRWGRYVRQLENVQRIRDVHEATSLYLLPEEKEEPEPQEEDLEAEDEAGTATRCCEATAAVFRFAYRLLEFALRTPERRRAIYGLLRRLLGVILRPNRLGPIAATGAAYAIGRWGNELIIRGEQQ